jgi:hypothetical protein
LLDRADKDLFDWITGPYKKGITLAAAATIFYHNSPKFTTLNLNITETRSILIRVLREGPMDEWQPAPDRLVLTRVDGQCDCPAIGAQAAFPGRQVVLLSGQSGFQMLMGDFLSLVQL